MWQGGAPHVAHASELAARDFIAQRNLRRECVVPLSPVVPLPPPPEFRNRTNHGAPSATIDDDETMVVECKLVLTDEWRKKLQQTFRRSTSSRRYNRRTTNNVHVQQKPSPHVYEPGVAMLPRIQILEESLQEQVIKVSIE